MNINNDYCVFILSHGRPNNVITTKTLKRGGYTGKYFIVVDDEDSTLQEYIDTFGVENVKVFNKAEIAKKMDEGSNFTNRKSIVYARNYCFELAKELGYEYFIQLDDDYYYFGYRYDTGAKVIKQLDNVFKIVFDFFKSTTIKTIAFSQGGDHIGGFSGIKMKRKAMNSFFCSTKRPFKFMGAINEDVNTYVNLGSKGDIFFTFTNLQLDQKDSQSQKDGMSETYTDNGTYVKSFFSVMYNPSNVKVSIMNTKHQRIHHLINWGATAPMIISPKHKKQQLLEFEI